MNTLDRRRTLTVLFTSLLFVGALWIAWVARRPLVTTLFAVLFAYLLEPLVLVVQRRLRASRVRAIAATYLALSAALAVAGLVAAPRVADEVSTISDAVPTYVAQVRTGSIAQTIGERFGWSAQTTDATQAWLATHTDDLATVVQSFGERLAELSTNIGWIVLIPILAFFFLKDKALFNDAMLSAAADESQRLFVQRVMTDLDRMVAQYIRAQMLFALIGMVAYITFLSLIRFPNALGLGVMGGILEFIPFVGPAINAAVLFVVGFFGGFPHWALVLAFLAAWRMIQDYVTSPYLMGEGLELHPVAAILGVLIGGEIGGVPGMFLSIPVIAGLRIVIRNWRSVGGLAPSKK